MCAVHCTHPQSVVLVIMWLLFVNVDDVVFFLLAQVLSESEPEWRPVIVRPQWEGRADEGQE